MAKDAQKKDKCSGSSLGQNNETNPKKHIKNVVRLSLYGYLFEIVINFYASSPMIILPR